MKKWIMFLIASVSFHIATAQTFDEWFKQKKTQIKYLVNQIAALQVYNDYLEKGYKIVHEGSSLINNIKQGDFNLHDNYFQSLSKVKPGIKILALVADIISDQANIISQFQRLQSWVRNSKWFNDQELRYIQSVHDNLISECEEDLAVLGLVISDDKVQMTDDQRLQRLENIHRNMKDKSAFTRAFSAGIIPLSGSRIQDYNQTELEKQFYNLH